MTYKLYFANDAGNDSLKGTLFTSDGTETAKQIFNAGEDIECPSVIAMKDSLDVTAPVEFSSEAEKDAYMDDFLKHMDVSITSSSVSESGRFLVGQAALDSTMPLTHFDYNDLSGKSEVDLTLLLTLSNLAGKRVQDAYKKGEDLDNQLKMDVYMTTALPISEAKQPNVLRNYRKRYMDNTHIVTFHNFKNPISVSLQFKNVFVGLEGEVAFAAIKNSPNAYPELANSIINSLKEKYPKVADKINNQFIKNIKDAIGFDLGGKTSDCTVITNGKPNIMASNSIMRGYDNVLQRSVDYLQTKNYGFDNIRQLQKYLNEDENPFAPGSKEKVIKVVSSAAEPFADEIVSNASQTLRKIGTSIKIGFVFGGAAVPMKTTRLYEKLNNKFMSFNGDQIIPIVWVDVPYAQVLNRMGLVLILKALMGPKE
ncbi:hypothetical protein IMSAG044_00258 [Lactobacillaceae bacterium]|nr:hypothetical protein IMSAG044_00258 [Lactobacillaceae bacterium]